MVSVVILNSATVEQKQPWTIYKKCIWLYSNETLFTNIRRGPDCPVGCSLTTPDVDLIIY